MFQPYLFSRTPIDTAVNMYSSFLNKLPIQMIWFDPTKTTNEMNCSYLYNFTAALATKIKVKIGIASYTNSGWASKFGNNNACPQFSIFPLLWTYSGPSSWEVIGKMGGWSHYDLKYLSY